MKNIFKSILALACCGAIFASCEQEVPETKMSADLTSIEVEAQNPESVAVTLTTDASWILICPDWVTPSATYGTGDSIISFTFAANYKDETTSTRARSGEIKISGGGALTGKGAVVTIAVNQAGYTYVDPNPAIGGIDSAEELVAFAKAVNGGTELKRWLNDEGKICLLNDIDMSGVTEWTPIGSSVFTWASNALACKSGNMFAGHFDGQGYSIKNFKMVCENAEAGSAWGLFGGLAPGAIVENIVIDSSCSLTVNTAVATDCGVVAGMVWDARVKNIVNNASMSYTCESGANARITMGVVGMAFAGADSAVVKKVVNNGKVVAASGGSAQNGGAAIQPAGILGFGTNLNGATTIVAVVDCVNNGDMESATARTSGIVAAANRYTHIRGCVNNGNQINSFNLKTEGDGSAARIGNITCITGAGSCIYDSVNNGDVISTTKGAVAGIICLVNDDTNVFENVASYGRVITDRTPKKYCGTFFGQCNKKATFTNCIAGGSFGTYNNGEYQMTPATAENYWDYIGAIGANGVNATKDNIKFGTK